MHTLRLMFLLSALALREAEAYISIETGVPAIQNALWMSLKLGNGEFALPRAGGAVLWSQTQVCKPSACSCFPPRAFCYQLHQDKNFEFCLRRSPRPVFPPVVLSKSLRISLREAFAPRTMRRCARLALVPCFMRKHLEPLAELEGGCGGSPLAAGTGLFQEERVRARRQPCVTRGRTCLANAGAPCAGIGEATRLGCCGEATTRSKNVGARLRELGALRRRIRSQVTEATVPGVKDVPRNVANLGPDPAFGGSGFT